VLYSFRQDEAIGVVNPVSDGKGWSRICKYFPPGHNSISLAKEISKIATEATICIYNACGFYFAIKRLLFNPLGQFDELYGHGYHEEADFCMRILSHGYRVVLNEGLFIHHHCEGSFGEQRRARLIKKTKHFFISMGNQISSLQEVLEKRKSH